MEHEIIMSNEISQFHKTSLNFFLSLSFVEASEKEKQRKLKSGRGWKGSGSGRKKRKRRDGKRKSIRGGEYNHHIIRGGEYNHILYVCIEMS